MTKKLFCHLSLRYLPLQYFGDEYYKLGKTTKNKSYLSWIAVLLLNSFSHDISHIKVLNWSMPSSKKHVYLEKNKWLNFNIFFLNCVIFLRRPKTTKIKQIKALPSEIHAHSPQNIAYFCKLGIITKRGDFDSSYCRWYSKAKQNLSSVIYLV
jgi:hypothetical protein